MLTRIGYRKKLIPAFIAIVSATFIIPNAQADQSDRPMVLILGTFHFKGSDSDKISVTMGDVKSPRRQAEIEALIDRLKAFSPTKIAVELSPEHEDEFNEKYRKYRSGKHDLSANERQQIGMRLAKKLGHNKLYAVDYPQDMQMDRAFAAAEAAGQTAEIASFQRKIDSVETQLKQAQTQKNTILDALRFHNGPLLKTGNQIYLQLALFGKPGDLAGAEAVGAWYERNLKIYANIAHLVESPNERIVVIIGSGHAPLLTSFFEQNPDFTLVQAMKFLAG